jgi:hypothetical protein
MQHFSGPEESIAKLTDTFSVFGAVFFVLTEELFNESIKWLFSLILLKNSNRSIQIGEIFHNTLL